MKILTESLGHFHKTKTYTIAMATIQKHTSSYPKEVANVMASCLIPDLLPVGHSRPPIGLQAMLTEQMNIWSPSVAKLCLHNLRISQPNP
jgi:hypothetical protein